MRHQAQDNKSNLLLNVQQSVIHCMSNITMSYTCLQLMHVPPKVVSLCMYANTTATAFYYVDPYTYLPKKISVHTLVATTTHKCKHDLYAKSTKMVFLMINLMPANITITVVWKPKASHKNSQFQYLGGIGKSWYQWNIIVSQSVYDVVRQLSASIGDQPIHSHIGSLTNIPCSQSNSKGMAFLTIHIM